jgi:hypothetical protein
VDIVDVVDVVDNRLWGERLVVVEVLAVLVSINYRIWDEWKRGPLI